MKFGVYIGPIYPGDMGGAEAFEFSLAISRAAHESGFDGLFAAHHHLLGPSHMVFNPFLTLARMSAEFPGGYLGTACFQLPLAHPVQVAEATALLDVMSGGKIPVRCRTGLSQGGVREPRDLASERGARLAEAVQAVRVLWTGQTSSFEGRFYRFEDVSIRPTPIQQPGPPVWVGADTVRRSPASPISAMPGSQAAAIRGRLSGRRSRAIARGWRSLGDHSRGCRSSARCMSPRTAAAPRRG